MQLKELHEGPSPATVVMMPLGAATFRIRLFPVSVTKRFPEASTATPWGMYNDAEVAGPPSPEKPLHGGEHAPTVPATVVMMPPCMKVAVDEVVIVSVNEPVCPLIE
jgi:hypothetical protein